jgi:signal transduction histidine kinase/outer membrane murein-binding lipoprotein Lpp
MAAERTVKWLLARAFATVVGLVVTAGATELAVVLVQDAAQDQLSSHVQPLSQANAHLRSVLNGARGDLRGYSLAGDLSMGDTFDAAAAEYSVTVRELRAPATAGYRPLINAEVAAADTWWKVARTERANSPFDDQAINLAEASEPQFTAFIDSNDALDRGLSTRAATLHRRATRLSWATVGVVTLLTVASALAAAVIAVRTSRRITGPLSDVVRVLDQRRAGDHEVRVGDVRGPAEIRRVAIAVNETADQEERVRATELRQALQSRDRERQLAGRLAALENAKTDFMSTVSHELRTPLTSISGYLELIMDTGPGALSAAQVRMLEVIGRNAARLHELIEDMLTLANIETGVFRAETELLDLAPVIERTVTAAGPAAEKASVGLHADVRGPLPLIGDAVQLDRALTNLLTNAVKFTAPEGTVSVHAERRGDELVVTVADTGMGIPADEQQALFTRFFRATNAIHRAVPGTGLGLAIVRTIVDHHGGSISITSTENVGTTATVRLPVSTDPAPVS